MKKFYPNHEDERVLLAAVATTVMHNSVPAQGFDGADLIGAYRFLYDTTMRGSVIQSRLSSILEDMKETSISGVIIEMDTSALAKKYSINPQRVLEQKSELFPSLQSTELGKDLINRIEKGLAKEEYPCTDIRPIKVSNKP